MEAEAYTKRMLFTVENFMGEVTAAMVPAPELIYIYSHIDYQLMEMGQNKPTIVPEMILPITLRLAKSVTMAQQIHRRLGIEAPLFASACMVNGLKFEVMGQQAQRSNPPHGMFYRSPGAATMPI